MSKRKRRARRRAARNRAEYRESALRMLMDQPLRVMTRESLAVSMKKLNDALKTVTEKMVEESVFRQSVFLEFFKKVGVDNAEEVRSPNPVPPEA
jgi:hypothetical protein